MGYAVLTPDKRWCARHTYARLLRQSRSKRRASYPTVPVSQYVDFLTHWQHVAPDAQLEGREGLRQVIDQLQGVELAAGEWESAVLRARVKDYRPQWLDELCLAGEVTWARSDAAN
jgi:ATP-dependent Lhr-like helicase